MANNNLLLNAAKAGYISGALAAQNISDPVQANYTLIGTQAQEFATQVDTQIPNDVLISAGGGAALPPTTAVITEDQAVRTQLIFGLAHGYALQRWGVGQLSAAFTVPAAAIKAAYLQALVGTV